MFGAVLVMGSLISVACSSGGSTPRVTPSPTPTFSGAVTPTPTINPSSQPGTVGIAYLPDGGNAPSFHGIQLVHFEDISSNLLVTLPTSAPLTVPLAGAGGPFIINADGTAALVAISGGSTANCPNPALCFPWVQDVYASSGGLTPLQGIYAVNASPTPNATGTGPSPRPTLNDVTSLAIVGSGTSSVGVALDDSSGGLLGITSLTIAPPQYGGFAPFAGPSNPPAYPRANVIQGIDSTHSTRTLLVRGPSDLASYGVTISGSGYTFAIKAADTTLGTGTTVPALRGYGAMAISPADSTRALVLVGNNVVLLTGLPNAIFQQSAIRLPSTPHTVAINSTGYFGAVGADNGIYVVSGVNSGVLGLVAPFAPGPYPNASSPRYVGCNGTTSYYLQNVYSIGFSADGKYLAALGVQPGANCFNGYNATLIAVPFNNSTGTVATPGPSPTPSPTPAPSASLPPTAPPTMFTQNNIVAPPANQDYMFVR